ncbi:hypothetical protein V8G54_005582 [Vigna mungo]|uniref:Uncharacterized protein n=1 Tax=Vigna mungo TaxID=3915 RepID=A0AAQ3NYJ3_VIGMU
MENHPDETNERNCVLQNLVLPVNPFVVVFFLKGLAAVFLQNPPSLGHEGLAAQTIAGGGSGFEKRERRKMREKVEAERYDESRGRGREGVCEGKKMRCRFG